MKEDIVEAKNESKLYEAIFNNTYQFTGLMDPDGTLIEANEAALDFGDVSRDDVIGKKMWNAYWFRISEETQEQTQADVQRAAAGEFVRRELKVQGGNGSTIIDFSIRPITDDDGNIMLLIPEGRDISELKERERRHESLTEELQEKTGYLDAILEYTTRPLFMKAASGEYLLANREYQQLFGLQEEEIIGRTDYDLHSKEMAEEVWENDQHVLETEEPVEIEERILVDGEERIYLASKVPVYFDKGDSEPDAVFGMATDVTERKAREEELERMNARLEEFASVVSHDLRNPLNVAEGRLVLAQEEYSSEHLSAVEQSLERMRMLIDDLLTLAREGEEVTDLEPVALTDLMAGCWKNVETDDATLQFDGDRTLLADKSRLQQLCENLLRNAIEHGEDTVKITVGMLDTGFYIEDDGPGIPEDEREQIFEAGYSTSATGTGFGLRIVEQVAEAHGWSIRATEGADGGARFEVTGVEFMDS